jgi:hypothetical protein
MKTIHSPEDHGGLHTQEEMMRFFKAIMSTLAAMVVAYTKAKRCRQSMTCRPTRG